MARQLSKGAALFIAVFASIGLVAQTPAAGTDEYAALKDAGTLPQTSLSIAPEGPLPFLDHNILSDAANRSDCFVEHDPNTWTNFPSNDDGSTDLINLPFSFDLYGTTYTSLYINNNGNLTFNEPFSSYTPDGFPISTPMVAPFWGDVDTRNGDRGEVWYTIEGNALYVNWVEVGPYSANNPSLDGLVSTFQVIITDGTDPALEPGNNIAFNYLDMGWTTGDASDGNLGFGGSPATVGVNSGNGADFIQLGRFIEDTDNYDGPFGAFDGVNWLEDQCIQFNVSDADNFPPIASNFPGGNTLNVTCDSDVPFLNLNFSGPEENQTVEVEIETEDPFNLIANNSGNPATVEISFEDLEAGEYSYTFVATDNGVPSASSSTTLTVIVDQCCEPSIAIECPADATIECGSEDSPEALGFPSIETSECTAEVEVTYMDDVISDDNCPTVIARTWMATDGTVTELCTQTITVEDTQAPVFVIFPEDMTIGCEEGQTAEDVLAYLDENVPFPTIEDCNNFTTETIVELQNEGLDCPVIAVCTKTIVATDECGNAASQTLTITIEDTTAPIIEGVEPLIEVSCIEEVPGPVMAEAYDECSDELVEVETFESNTGQLVETCVATTSFAPGDDWAVWLPTLEVLGLTATDDFVPSGDGLTFEVYADGTAHLFGLVENNTDASQKWEVSIWLENQRDWDEWSGLGRSYKDSFGFAEAGGDLWTTWNFYELVNGFSVLTGADALAGSVLYLEHMPANFYHGFQCGEAANDRNANFGMSGWFTFSGQVSGEYIEGHGDVNVDKECTPVDNPDDCPNTDEFTYLYRAEDACGNASILEQIIEVNDEIAPEFTVVPEDVTVQCDVPELFEGVEAEDNCECGVEELNYLGEIFIEGDNECSYQLQRIWEAIDCCNNRAEYVQTITVSDTIAPEFTVIPEDVTVECDQEVPTDMAEGVDNCHEVTASFEDEIIEGECPQEYTIIRTHTLDDGCGNIATAEQTINVVDTTAPVFDYDVEIAVECTEVENVTVNVSDNCGEVTLTFEDVIQSGGCLGVIYRVYTAVDECGNESTAEQFITVEDTTPPVIETPEDFTVECSEIPEAPGADGINIFDNCEFFATSDEVTVEFSEEIVEGDCENNYQIVWTWVATDYCENVSEASTIVTVQDTTDPVFVQVPEDITYECDEEIPACDPSLVIAEDNCDVEVTIECEDQEIAGDCPNEFTIQRMYRAFDNCGNEAMYVQTISVVDTTAPVVTPADDVTVECDQDLPAPSATATDNCGEAEISVEDSIIEGECANEYTLVYTYTAIDECGNVSEPVSQNIFVVDTTAPVFDEYPVEIDVPCDNIDAEILTAQDNCGDVEITWEDTFVSGGCEGTIIRDYFATDECGNVAEAQQIIHLFDEVAPEFVEFPADETVECDAVPAVAEGLFATDNCDEEVEIEYLGEEIIEGDCPQSYTIIRTWAAEDNCDNITEQSQTIIVEDTTAPEFDFVAEDVTVECDQELPAPDASATDNCGEVTITSEDLIEEGECAQEFVVTRIYTATDECGNSNTAEQIITVVDTTAPDFDFVPENMTIECDEELPAANAEASDNCGEVEITFADEVLQNEGECEGFAGYYDPSNWSLNTNDGDGSIDVVDGVLTITGNNNEFFGISTEATITASGTGEYSFSWDYQTFDVDGPSFDIAYYINGERFDLTADDAGFTQNGVVTFEANEGDLIGFGIDATDGSMGAAVLEISNFTFPGDCEGCPQNETIVRTFTATDECGNSTTAEQIINVVDTTAPVFDEYPVEIDVPCDSIDVATLTATDNCGEVTIDFEDTFVSGGCEGTIIRDYTATDECGNVSTAQQIIHLIDEVAPEFVEFPEDATVECDNVPAAAEEVFATDNCDDEVMVEYLGEEIVEGDCPQSYTIIRTWAAEDNCDNITEQSQTITVVDTTAPEFEIFPEDETVECDMIPEVATGAAAFDNCDEDVTIEYLGEEIIEGECADSYTIVRTWVASDDCGNETVQSQNITVQDTTAPVFDMVADDVTIECDVELPAPMASATDNCGEVSITNEDVIEETECATEYTLTRTYTATDECGNATTAVQIITVVDTTAPELSGLPEAELVIDCEDDVPAVADVTAFDNCEGDVEVSFTEELIGELPPEGSSAFCNAMTPEAFEDGETCAGTEIWSVVLFNFAGEAASYYSTIDASWTEFPDGSAVLTGTVSANNNPDAGWEIAVEFENGMDWDMWSTQGFPTSFKDDCDIAGDEYLDWMYYIMSEGATLTGWGDYEGSVLNLSHAPSNLYYGYQVGVAANNVNANYGGGGWFTYDGIFLGDEVNGSGDFAFDHDCCPQYEIVRTWCATDCVGNETCFTQVISFADLGGDVPGIDIETEEAVEMVSKGDQVSKLRAYPNPAINKTFIEFSIAENGLAKVEIFGLNGQKVAELFHADAQANEAYRFEYSTVELPAGVYLYRLTTEYEVITDRLIIKK